MTKPPEKLRFQMRLLSTLAERIDHWRRSQPDFPNRAEAARRLIEIGLARIIHEKLRQGLKLLV